MFLLFEQFLTSWNQYHVKILYQKTVNLIKRESKVYLTDENDPTYEAGTNIRAYMKPDLAHTCKRM